MTNKKYDPTLKDKIIARLKNHKMTLNELADKFHKKPDEMQREIDSLINRGIPIDTSTQHNREIVLSIDTQPQLGNVYIISEKDNKPRTMDFCASSDLHFASVYHMPRTFHEAMKVIEDKGITRVYVAGDIVDGNGQIYKGHLENLITSNLDKQTDIAAEAFTKHPTLEFWGISGNHSLHKDTEVLTIGGWKKVIECTKEDEIGQFDIKTKILSFAKPLELENHFEDKIYCFKSHDMCQKVSWGHDLVINDKKVKAIDAIKMDLKEESFPLSIFKKQKGINLSDNIIRILVWVVCDGTIVNYKKYEKNSKKIRIQFKLSRLRKINDLKDLLDKANIKYTFALCKKTGVNKLQPYYIRIYGDDARNIYSLLNGIKQFPNSFLDANKEQTKIIYNELAITDGSLSREKHLRLTSINKKDLDLLQQIFLINGYITKIDKVNSHPGFPNGKPQFTLIIKKQSNMNWKIETKIEDYDDLVYCFVMPLGTLVTRFEGKIALTGNCFSFTQQNGVRALSLIEDKCDNFKDLGDLRADIIYHGIKIRLLHGASGRCYATSYASQIYLRDLFKGSEREEIANMPHIIILGHYHTLYQGKDHGIYIIQPSSFQDSENEYCIRRGLTGPNGCLSVHLQYQDGKINQFQTEFIQPRAAEKERGLIAKGKRIDLEDKLNKK